MSSTDARWEPRRVRLEEKLEELEDLWTSLEQDLDKVRPEFDAYLQKVRSSVEDTVQSIRNSIFKLDWKRNTGQEALQRGVEKDPPSYKRRASEGDVEKLPNPYHDDSWYPHSRSNSPSPARKVPLRLRTHIVWGDFKRCLGSKLMMCIIMAILCTAGLITNILSVLKWTAGNQTPLIDSNFWSVLSQSNIGIAAIYSVIIPQLQTGQSPVPRKSQWLFNGFLSLSVLTALLATIVYPWHGRTSIIAAFVICTMQLAVTLQMILSAGAKIQNLEMENYAAWWAWEWAVE